MTVTAHYRRGGMVLDLPGGSRSADAVPTEAGLRLALDGLQRPVEIERDGAALNITVDGVTTSLWIEDPLAAAAAESAGPGRLTAPMPGKVVAVAVKVGDAVRRGERLIVLEAMKMEHSIAAPADGIVAELRYAAGDLVEEGAELVRLEEAASPR